jgi:hypothetical protein
MDAQIWYAIFFPLKLEDFMVLLDVLERLVKYTLHDFFQHIK